jgi:hypothetical protein
VGTGLSGLSCALSLLEGTNESVEIVLIDAKSHCGGRVSTRSLPQVKGAYFDAGAEWIHGMDENFLVNKLAASGAILQPVAIANPWMHSQYMPLTMFIESSDDPTVVQSLVPLSDIRQSCYEFRDLISSAVRASGEDDMQLSEALNLIRSDLGYVFKNSQSGPSKVTGSPGLSTTLLGWQLYLATLWFGREVLNMYSSCVCMYTPRYPHPKASVQ